MIEILFGFVCVTNNNFAAKFYKIKIAGMVGSN